MSGVNCWEFKKCGREPGGRRVSELGVCRASTETRTTGVNHGTNGGRACWALAGTLCGGVVQGSFAMKLANCRACTFYDAVRAEEGQTFVYAREILTLIG